MTRGVECGVLADGGRCGDACGAEAATPGMRQRPKATAARRVLPSSISNGAPAIFRDPWLNLSACGEEQRGAGDDEPGFDEDHEYWHGEPVEDLLSGPGAGGCGWCEGEPE